MIELGFWKRKDGTMVELIFDDNGRFVKFGGDISEEEAETIKKEIYESLREQNIVDCSKCKRRLYYEEYKV